MNALIDDRQGENDLPEMKDCLWCCESIRKNALKCKHCSTLCSEVPSITASNNANITASNNAEKKEIDPENEK
jgi:hypothetical protein